MLALQDAVDLSHCRLLDLRIFGCVANRVSTARFTSARRKIPERERGVGRHTKVIEHKVHGRAAGLVASQEEQEQVVYQLRTSEPASQRVSQQAISLDRLLA